MRINISKKIFAIFFTLTLVTFLLAFLVIHALTSLRTNTAQITVLQEFKLQIHRLTALTDHSHPHSSDDFQARLENELAAAATLSEKINAGNALLPGPLAAALQDISKHMGYYRQAMLELHEKHLIDQRLHAENAELSKGFPGMISKAPTAQQLEFATLFTSTHSRWQEFLTSGDGQQINEMKKLLAATHPPAGSPDLLQPVDRFIKNAEAMYFNSLAVNDRQNFLAATSYRFQEVAQAAITTISETNRRRHLQLQQEIVGLLVIAVVLNLLLWFVSARYLARFLDKQRLAMQSIKAGDYGYELTAPTNDELGDQILFMREMSFSLEQSRRQLTDSEKKYRQLVEEVSDLVWETNGKDQYTYVNPAIHAMLGLQPDMVLGRTINEMMPGIEGWKNKRLLEMIRDHLPFQAMESGCRHQAGHLVVLESSAQPKFGPDGSFQGYLGKTRDITRRKREEEMLRESRRFLQSVIDGVSDPIMVIGLDYRVSLMNDAAQRFALAHSQIGEGRACHQLSHNSDTPCDGALHPWPLAEVRASGQPVTMIHEHYQNDNNTRYIEITAYPLRNVDGAIIGIIESCRDISLRLSMEQELVKTKNLLNNIINSMPSTLVGVDTAGIITHWNQEAEITTGIAHKDALGRPLDQIFPMLSDHLAETQDSLRKRLPHNSTQFLPRENGDLRCTEIMVYPLIANGIDGAVIRMDDITDQLRLEEKMTRTEDEKQKLQAQLLQAQKLESIGRLAGGVAHDFNNLLTGIMGYSELTLMQLPSDHPARENISFIHEAGLKAEGLTRQLLAFSRKQVLEMLPVNLDTIIQNLAKMLHRLIGEDIALEIKPNPVVRNVLADAGQIEQILMNLAVNARDAMPAGGRLIIETSEAYLDETIATTDPDLQAGLHVVVTVSDTGLGMSREIQEKIFEPFFTTKDIGKGTGLGLATVFGIVKQHKGHIWVYSEPGHGTSFRIYLPVVDAKPTEQTGGPTAAAMFPRGTETILVVDDDEVSRRLMTDTLAPLGYQVLQAASGSKALELCKGREDQIQLLVSDVIMPGMHGRALAEAILAIHPGLKVIFISGYTENILSSLGISTAQSIFFLPKPLLPSTLAKKIRQVLDGKKAPPSEF
ncbi:MAG: hypothetical protein A2521_14110 [Deltaproteobacteria bacterium RIFOXYD12_FULL_57_12]|nr:MAG: hypothetical protein A2521_14110 [Deltaproteobacteria bacterium RIFOXYD12_FULL_57_12]